MKRRSLRLGASLALGGLASAQPVLWLKGRGARPIPGPDPIRGPRRTKNVSGSHLLIQFAQTPTKDQLASLTDRNIQILQYVPDNGFLVQAPFGTDLDGLGIGWLTRLNSQDKFSPEIVADLAQQGAKFYLVEFFSDVDMGDARSIALEANARIVENPDLLSSQLLIQGSREALSAIADWDEVAYIFPASDEMVNGVPTQPCAGALTKLGPVGQMVAQVGDGWDGPGQGGADLFYAFSQLSEKLPADVQRSEIARAFAEWAKYAKLTFTPSNDLTGNKTIEVLFGKRAHGDPYPFDGQGGVLAHTFYPTPTNPEPLAGDMHLDGDENWRQGASTDLFSVALHEAGHALGLGHSDKPGAVMYPYYKQVTGLTQEDIAAVLRLYAAQSSTLATPAPAAPVSPTVPISPLSLTIGAPPSQTTDAGISLQGMVAGGSGDVTVSWFTGPGSTGLASGGRAWRIGNVPLTLGLNTITVIATDSANRQIAQSIVVTRQMAATLPILTFSSPAANGSFTATTGTITVSGNAAHASGISRVTWTNNRGGAGQASGSTTWNSGPIALQQGLNLLDFRAYASNGSYADRTLQITFASGQLDTTAPSLAILSPVSTSVSTTATSIAFRGTAWDNVGVTAITWANSAGTSGVASGLEAWSTPPIPLLVGTNTIVIRASDASGNVGWRSVTVTRH